jgi:menaquinone-specific isochorismate synthase
MQLATTERVITQPQQLDGTLIVCSQPCPDLPLVDFLRRTHGQRRIYWENERESLTFAGFGAAVDLIANGEERFEQINTLAERLFNGAVQASESDVMPLLFGGFAFRDDFVAQVVWEGMHAAHFVLPGVMLRRDGDQSHLILSEYLPAGTDVDAARQEIKARFEMLFDDLFWNFAGDVWNPEWEEASDIEYPMSYDAWERMITNATTQMKRGNLDKVVLSRMCQIRFSNPVNVVRALEYLRGAYGSSYRFLFEPQPNNAFYGATPETLVKVQGRDVYADALAGTIRRGETAEEDGLLAQQILSDPKERREHDLVVQGLRQHLATYVDTLHADDEPGILQLSNVQHLHTPVSGQLKDDYGILKMVEALHPTPALGGSPRAVAELLISDLEPITRGWYAAPIGWLDHERNGHFGVGIRAAVSRKGTLWCYAGGGVVAESEPEREWRETDLKFRPMLNAVGIQTR